MEQLMKVAEVSREILKCRPARVYENIRRNVYPPGVVVFLSEKSIRFHRDKLVAWIESGGAYRAARNGNGAHEEQRAA
jgi:hypothetical protein